jgi:hypothetical protein
VIFNSPFSYKSRILIFIASPKTPAAADAAGLEGISSRRRNYSTASNSSAARWFIRPFDTVVSATAINAGNLILGNDPYLRIAEVTGLVKPKAHPFFSFFRTREETLQTGNCVSKKVL